MPDDSRPVLVTGANGQIALQLFERMAERGIKGRALVRSARAAAQVEALREEIRPEIRVLEEGRGYSDIPSLVRAAEGCRAIVHLVGILKEASTSTYQAAHEDSCTAIAEAADKNAVDRVVYLSIFGSTPGASNACLASKGRAEVVLLDASTPVTVLRVPMVIGPDDPASRALRAQAKKPSVTLVGGGKTIHQPIDIRDLLAAIVASLEDSGDASHAFDLGGPEALSYAELVGRAAQRFGQKPKIRGIPVGLVNFVAGVMEKISKDPPITRAMLGVLEHDDRIDNGPALAHLGIDLTPLDDTLATFIAPEANPS